MLDNIILGCKIICGFFAGLTVLVILVGVIGWWIEHVIDIVAYKMPRAIRKICIEMKHLTHLVRICMAQWFRAPEIKLDWASVVDRAAFKGLLQMIMNSSELISWDGQRLVLALDASRKVLLQKHHEERIFKALVAVLNNLKKAEFILKKEGV